MVSMNFEAGFILGVLLLGTFKRHVRRHDDWDLFQDVPPKLINIETQQACFLYRYMHQYPSVIFSIEVMFIFIYLFLFPNNPLG